MGIHFIKVSVIYFILVIGFGMYVGFANKFAFTSAHAHIGLLGWVSLGLSGVIYQLFPLANESRLAAIHFWLHMFGIPILTIAMILFGLGNFEIGGPLSGIGGTLVFAGVIVFTINVFKNIRSN